MLADVVLPSRRFQVFTYQVPSQFLSRIHVGSPVTVPLGSAEVAGLVVSVFERQPVSSPQRQFHYTALRPILSIEAESKQAPLGHNLFQLVGKISEYYLAPLSSCLRLIVPPHSMKVIRRVFLTEQGRAALVNQSLSDDARAVLRKLEHAPKGLLRSSLKHSLPNASAALASVKKKRWVVERTTVPSGSNLMRKDSVSRPKQKPAAVVLDFFDQQDNCAVKTSAEQQSFFAGEYSVWQTISSALTSDGFQEISVVNAELLRRNLLMKTVEAICMQGRQTIVLTPEVHQVETLALHLRKIWKDQVEIYHGHLSSSDRSVRWERIRQGEIRIVVGTRSALFLPLSNVGLVWVEQEEDQSYKDEHLPYYHARDVARMRGEVEGALVVYGATRPSLETYARFREQINFPSELTGSHVPIMEMIDLRTLPFGTTLSPMLLASMTCALEAGQQIIIFLNRKGFSRALVCRDCGQAPHCLKCGVALKLFQRPPRLVCSFCESTQSTPEICPGCQGTIFRFSGMGTQRLEEELVGLFPLSTIARLDRENVKTEQEVMRILQQFRQKEIQVLIGTEFLLHQSTPVSAPLIILPQADLGLHIPDFRSAERTFHMLSKAVGLAHDIQQPGQVILQTRMPDHHVLRAIHQHEPHLFYEQEFELREALGYPPATHVILLVVTGEQANRVQRVVDSLGQQLTSCGLGGISLANGKGMLQLPMVLGPMTSKKPGSGKKNRTLFLIKTADLPGTQHDLREIQRELNDLFPKDAIICEINVDPIEIQ
jgi:primosomal protein N' (replication factor Y) (superfamily II helicase)